MVMWSRGGLTWRSQVGANPIPIPHPTNLALGLFVHKITLYRFNQGGGSYYCRGGSNLSRRAEPHPCTPHFHHWLLCRTWRPDTTTNVRTLRDVGPTRVVHFAAWTCDFCSYRNTDCESLESCKGCTAKRDRVGESRTALLSCYFALSRTGML